MNTSTLSIIETAINTDESITPEQASLFLSMVHGTAKHLSSRETATVCGKHISTVRHWTWNGELDPCDVVSGCYRFAPSDVWRKIITSGEKQP